MTPYPALLALACLLGALVLSFAELWREDDIEEMEWLP